MEDDAHANAETTMRWFKKYPNDSPRLISLSPLRHSDQPDGSILSYYSHRDDTENDCNASFQSLPQTPITVNKRRIPCASPLATATASTPAATSATMVACTTNATPSISSTATNTINIRKSRIGNYFHFFLFEYSNWMRLCTVEQIK